MKKSGGFFKKKKKLCVSELTKVGIENMLKSTTPIIKEYFDYFIKGYFCLKNINWGTYVCRD